MIVGAGFGGLSAAEALASAPVAKQKGRHVARRIRRRAAGSTLIPDFRYRHPDSLATIGRSAAVIDFGWLRLKGLIAWWIWGVAHVYFLIGMRNRLLVAIQWLWSYIAFDRGARLITGKDELTSVGLSRTKFVSPQRHRGTKYSLVRPRRQD